MELGYLAGMSEESIIFNLWFITPYFPLSTKLVQDQVRVRRVPVLRVPVLGVRVVAIALAAVAVFGEWEMPEQGQN